ncbi:MAG: precorrin-2 C(20)-methyltransferase, partial [Desulfovibrio sp.]|nr:precorrin-2 C(20)-methyltransferase [Desulfovibrio sp.]
LYGVGVGPGDPDLLTIRAAKILKEASVVFAAASQANEVSLSLEIARPFLSSDTPVVRLDFPMTKDREKLEKAWKKAALTVRDNLPEDGAGVFLTLGDPLIYSTFVYLVRALAKVAPDIVIDVVPGITSFQAAAARLKTSLCEGNEAFCVLPGTASGKELAAFLRLPCSAAILKVYRNFPAIRAALAETDRLNDAALVVRATREDELVANPGDIDGATPYMSLIISDARRR